MSETEELYDLTDTPFVHLHVHSAYSLAEGAMQVKALVKMVAGDNAPAVALTDTNNLFGAGVQPILGMQLDLKALDGERSQIVVLVQNEIGYRNLCWIISEAYMKSEDTEKPAAHWSYLNDRCEGVICLSWADWAGFIGRSAS